MGCYFKIYPKIILYPNFTYFLSKKCSAIIHFYFSKIRQSSFLKKNVTENEIVYINIHCVFVEKWKLLNLIKSSVDQFRSKFVKPGHTLSVRASSGDSMKQANKLNKDMQNDYAKENFCNTRSIVMFYIPGNLEIYE